VHTSRRFHSLINLLSEGRGYLLIITTPLYCAQTPWFRSKTAAALACAAIRSCLGHERCAGGVKAQTSKGIRLSKAISLALDFGKPRAFYSSLAVSVARVAVAHVAVAATTCATAATCITARTATCATTGRACASLRCGCGGSRVGVRRLREDKTAEAHDENERQHHTDFASHGNESPSVMRASRKSGDANC
jgi:hypothetical protein